MLVGPNWSKISEPHIHTDLSCYFIQNRIFSSPGQINDSHLNENDEIFFVYQHANTVGDRRTGISGEGCVCVMFASSRFLKNVLILDSE